MGNKDLERLIRKVIKEAPVDYGDYPERMDPKSQKKVEDPEGIYAKNRAFKGGVSDVEKIAGTRFKEVVDYVKRYFGTEENITSPLVKRSIQMEQMRSVQQAMMIENSHKSELKDLAVEIAAKEEGWMPYTSTLEEAIEGGSINKSPIQGAGTRYGFEFINVEAFLNEQRINPNEFQMAKAKLPKLELPPNFSFDIDELTPEEQRQLEIEKRHVINAIIQGKGFKDRLDEIDPRLYSLYNKIMSANDLMYFTEEDLIEAMGGNAAGSSKIESSDDDEDEDEDGEDEGMDAVVANGIIFPILLHELVKGFASVASREQWRDVDPGMAQDVMGQTDIMPNEPMQFRVGGELVRKLKTLLPDELTIDVENRELLPFFERILYGIPADQFLRDIMANVISEVPADNEKAKRKFREILDKAKKDYQRYKGNDQDEDEDEDDDLLAQLGL